MARRPAVAEIEAAPEIDRLEGFPHPRETAVLFGHDAAERELAATFAGRRMHHAWMLVGPTGIGKATLAYRCARFALASPEERAAAGSGLAIPEKCITAAQVRALSHPGLAIVRRAYDPRTKRFPATIPVDEVRSLKTFLGRTADQGAWRVVVVDSADELNLNAANALLKALEEPPQRTLFLLVVAQPQRLLRTIRSRCRALELAPLEAADLRRAATAALAAAETAPPAETDWRTLEALAAGSVRRLLELSATDGLSLYRRIETLFEGLPRIDWPAAHALGEELASTAAEARFALFFDLLLGLIARLVRARASGTGNPEDVSLARKLIPEGRLASWAELWETIVRDKAETLALNLDRRMLILDTLARVERTAEAT
ncbi:MAG: DNA polymerase III subunit delta' [Hyphomicrobiaceae bacterium]